MLEEKTKRVINIQSVAIASKEQERHQQLEAEVISCIEQLPPICVEDWAKVQFMLESEGSLYNRAQVAKFKAVQSKANHRSHSSARPSWQSHQSLR